jgi:hypothetical protein
MYDRRYAFFARNPQPVSCTARPALNLDKGRGMLRFEKTQRPQGPLPDNMLSETEGFRFQDLAIRLPDTRSLVSNIIYLDRIYRIIRIFFWCSIFILSILLIRSENWLFMPLSFLLRLDRPFFGPAAGPAPDTYTLRHLINSVLTALQGPLFQSVVSEKA